MARADEQPDPGDTSTATTAAVVTQAGDEYTTRGQTRLATRRGYRFQPSNKDLPEVTASGISVTATDADAILRESDAVRGTVYKVDTDQDQEG